jgi:metal-responsive CopG/Arc/MetJ family transcriptional regulator
MANVKTAISINEPLFKEIEALAAEMKISRSSLFSLAARDFINQRKNRKLLDAINAAYDDIPDPEEEKLLEAAKAKYRKIADKW